MVSGVSQVIKAMQTGIQLFVVFCVRAIALISERRNFCVQVVAQTLPIIVLFLAVLLRGHVFVIRVVGFAIRTQGGQYHFKRFCCKGGR